MSTINREAGDKGKGIRFQKLRACIRLLTELSQDKAKRVSCAIELLEDSFLLDEQSDCVGDVEENKYFSSPISFNSGAVRNTIVAFIDIYFRFLLDDSLKFSFFACTKTSNEKFDSKIVEKCGSQGTLSTTSVLKKLLEGTPLSEFEKCVSRLAILREYEAQYLGRKGGHLSEIQQWSDSDFCEFLTKISWTVTDEGNDELEELALRAVRESPFFNHRLEGVEDLILSALLDLFEKRAESKFPTARLVHRADVEVIFLKAVGFQQGGKRTDPACYDWGSVVNTDVRNLEEKILAVSPTYPRTRIQKLNRRVSLAKYEASTWQREYVSLRRRIYDVCDDVLVSHKTLSAGALSPGAVDSLVDAMVDSSKEKLTQLSQTYHYQISDDETIRGAVLSLFDECYLVFD